MKIVSQVQEDEVIAEFLFAEVNSDRFKEGILHALGEHDLNLLIKPNLNDQAENQIRRDILGQTRGSVAIRICLRIFLQKLNGIKLSLRSKI